MGKQCKIADFDKAEKDIAKILQLDPSYEKNGGKRVRFFIKVMKFP